VADSILFTVFTPSYNRAHTLHRVYDSLCAQTLRDFEWIVIDDGSTDNTAELVADWTKRADFPIRYFKQKHAGKHIGHNLAVREARGRLFMVFDSDDACVPHALERIAYHWNSIPTSERHAFFAVNGLCCDQHGRLVGDRFPFSPFDSNLREKRYVHRVRGEKRGAVVTDVLRRFPFPEIKMTHFVPEGAIWLEISKNYKIRYVNEVFRIYFIDDDDTGATLTKTKMLDENAPGRLYYYVWLLNNDLSYFFHSPLPFLKAALMLPIAGWSSRQRIGRTLAELETLPARALVLLGLPIAFLLYVFDRLRKHDDQNQTESYAKQKPGVH
jgi:glycosyltransferase involved in cell wall biosynthesis